MTNQSAYLGHGRGLRGRGELGEKHGCYMVIMRDSNITYLAAEQRFRKLPNLAPPLTVGQLGDNVPIACSTLVPVTFEVCEVANGALLTW